MKPLTVDWPMLLQLLPTMSKSTIEEEIRKERFPKPRDFPGGIQSWLVSDIEAWVEGLPVKQPQIAVRKEETELYRHFDIEGDLLYVGISLSTVARLASHMIGSHWAGEIAKITIERFPTRDSALAAEKAAIKAEKPRHNITHAEQQ